MTRLLHRHRWQRSETSGPAVWADRRTGEVIRGRVIVKVRTCPCGKRRHSWRREP